MRTILCTLLIGITVTISPTLFAQAPHLEWVVTLGNENLEAGGSIVVDDFGQVITFSPLLGTLDLDPGPGAWTVTAPYGMNWGFVEVMDSTGQFKNAWLALNGSSIYGQSTHLYADQEGNIYLTGQFYTHGIAVDFDPGPGTYYLSTDANYTWGIFIVKYDNNFHFKWARSIDGQFDIAVGSIVVDESGNVYLSGSFSGAVDFDPSGQQYMLNSNNGYGFLLKLNQSGNFLWAKQLDASFKIVLQKAGLMTPGFLVAGGFFEGLVDFYPGPGVSQMQSNNGSVDAFISIMSLDGDLIWAKSMGGPESDGITHLAVNQYGSIFCVGGFHGTMDFDPGPGVFNLTALPLPINQYDDFMLALFPSGEFRWAFTTPSSVVSYEGVSICETFDVVGIGHFNGTVDFDPGPGSVLLSGKTSFVQRIDSDGNLIWARAFGDEGIQALAIDKSENIYLTGHFSKTADFDPNSGVLNLTPFGSGSSDYFLARWSQKPDAVAESTFPSPVTVYPSPTSGPFTLDLGDIYNNLTIKITSLNGQVLQQQFFSSARTLSLEVHWPEGMYLVSVIEEKGSQAILKLIKE